MSQRLAALLALLLLASACGGPGQNDTATPEDSEAPISDLAAIFDGAPANETLPDDNKADAVYPAKFDLADVQSPVRSQGARGTCTIFATTALMEHLYLAAGWPSADFSEQYLQWSVKNEVGAFPNTAGSNSSSNLQAINRYGIPKEEAWPYERSQWGASNDEACASGENLPTRCYTNGEPPAGVVAAEKYRLPAGRWVRTNSIKAHMTAKRTGVVIGVEFFYQSWNHRLTSLTANSEYWRSGYVTYPNAEDLAASREKPAGHGILLIGWDDTLEVPMRDGKGELILDADGNALKEKGFYIFKNSWGTGGFGVNNPFGDGYGFISMRYVDDFGTAYASDLPDVAPPVEICDDGADNDGNGLTDCADAACAASCGSGGETVELSSSPALAIPDNSPEGASDTITVSATGTVATVTVNTYISHTYQGDLRVALVHGDKTVVLHDRTGGAKDDLYQSFSLTEFAGMPADGPWQLVVSDHAYADVGLLEAWDLELTLE